VVTIPAVPSAEQFRQAVLDELAPLNLPESGRAGILADEAGRLLQAFSETRRPQAKQFAYPGDPNKSIVIALDFDRPGLEVDVLTPISREAEANLLNTEAQKIGDISFFVLVVERAPSQMDAAVQRVRRRLEGAQMPEAFENHMQPFLDRMPNGSLRSIYGKIRGILNDPNEPNEVIPSINVPDSNAQTAITFVVRDIDSLGLKKRFLEVIDAGKLAVVRAQNDESKELLVETRYADSPEIEPVYILRAVVNAPRDAESIRAVLSVISSEYDLHLAAGAEEQIVLPSATAVRSGVGLIVATGPGLRFGLGVRAAVRNRNGLSIPVAFIPATEAEATGLEERGVSSAFIFREFQYSSRADAAEAAKGFLSMQGVGAEELGVDGPITATAALLLENLFGIKLSAGAEEVWQRFMSGAEETFAAAA
jgi:hypothetical protein